MSFVLNRYRSPVCFALMVAIWALTSTARAQVDYLEPIGGTEVELYFFLDMGGGSSSAKQSGPNFTLQTEDVFATYTVVKGKVTHVIFRQSFESKKAASDAFNLLVQFFRDRGMGIDEIRQVETHRIVNAAGNGMHSTLIVVPDSGGYRINAEITAMR